MCELLSAKEKDAAAFDDGDIGLDLPPEALGFQFRKLRV